MNLRGCLLAALSSGCALQDWSALAPGDGGDAALEAASSGVSPDVFCAGASFCDDFEREEPASKDWDVDDGGYLSHFDGSLSVSSKVARAGARSLALFVDKRPNSDAVLRKDIGVVDQVEYRSSILLTAETDRVIHLNDVIRLQPFCAIYLHLSGRHLRLQQAQNGVFRTYTGGVDLPIGQWVDIVMRVSQDAISLTVNEEVHVAGTFPLHPFPPGPTRVHAGTGFTAGSDAAVGALIYIDHLRVDY